MSDIPGVPEFKELGEVKKWLEDRFASQYAGFGRDIEQEIRRVINEKHAPILIPQVTIDAAHAQKNLAAADAGANWAALSWQNSASTTSNAYQTALNHTGRGILTKLAIAEVTSGTNNNRTFGVKLTIDGNVLYDVANALTRESAIRVIVGNLIDVSGTNFALVDGSIGLPYNQNCKIEYISDGTRTLSIGWKVAKKL
jgi:hypothetical protein